MDGFDPLRDYPLSEYNQDIGRGAVEPGDVTVVEVHFALEPSDLQGLSEEYANCTYVYGRKLDNAAWHRLDDGPNVPTYGELPKDLSRLSAHIGKRKAAEENCRKSFRRIAATKDRRGARTALAAIESGVDGFASRTAIVPSTF